MAHWRFWLDYKWSLFRLVRRASRERKLHLKNGRAISWRREARERRDYRLSHRVFHGRVIFRCKFSISLRVSDRISYLDVLSLSPVDISPVGCFE